MVLILDTLATKDLKVFTFIYLWENTVVPEKGVDLRALTVSYRIFSTIVN
jgi:hypothetical protein